MIPPGFEVNIDGLVGPTHNYSGLSLGNLASMENKEAVSNPKRAALEGLAKMKFIADLGIRQAVLPPHERPHLPSLRALGFSGADRTIPAKVFQAQPELLFQYSSASSMWAANAATVTPSIDAVDDRVHLTPANFASKPHRSIEPPMTERLLKALFPNPLYFTLHPPLPISPFLYDEGGANHTRFCKRYGEPGVHLFVYGSSSFNEALPLPGKFPARQTLEAQQAIARGHQLNPEAVVFAQQAPEAIDAGVFHNDVISVGDQNLFFYHEQAFLNTEEVIEKIRQKVEEICGCSMQFIKVEESQVRLKTAVSTYLFNSQLIKTPEGAYALIAPIECQRSPSVSSYLDQLLKDPEAPFRELHYFNLRESMRNGGGPACLRLRVVLTEKELKAANPNFFLTDRLYDQLVTWVEKYYRDRLIPKDLADPKLVEEIQTALSELTRIMDLGSIYDFQR